MGCGLAVALIWEAARPRGGPAVLLDWDEVAHLARAGLDGDELRGRERGRVTSAYRRYAAQLEPVLLEVVGGMPEGTRLPEFVALDRHSWLDLNIGIMRALMQPFMEAEQLPRSWLTEAGRAGLDRYVALVLRFLGNRVLGQFDPQLLPAQGGVVGEPGLYLVEPNVAAWEREADLPSADLRRWLILHEMAHAWQFAAHQWLRGYLSRMLDILVSSHRRARGLRGLLTLTAGLPEQWAVLRRMQAAMSLVEGHGNLVMNLVGRRQLAGFDRLEAAYRERSGRRQPLERLVWRITGLEMKLEQYRLGERFAAQVHERYGMEVLNRAWRSAEHLPTMEELREPERWYRRIGHLP